MQKLLFPLAISRQAKLPQAISTPRLGVSQNPPAGRPRALAPDRRAIFMGHSVWGLFTEQGRPTPGMLSVNWQRPPKAGGRKAQDCGRERACNLAPKAQPVAPGEERVIHSSRPPDRGKKRFWCLLGLRPKGTAARHPCVIVRKVIAPHTRIHVCPPNRKRHAALSVGVSRIAQNIPSRDSAYSGPAARPRRRCMQVWLPMSRQHLPARCQAGHILL